MTTHTIKAYLTGFTVGSLVATAVALLYAPHSGKKTRNLLRTRKEEMQEKTKKFVNESKQRANQMLTQKATEVLDEASAMISHGQQMVEAAQNQVEDQEVVA